MRPAASAHDSEGAQGLSTYTCACGMHGVQAIAIYITAYRNLGQELKVIEF